MNETTLRFLHTITERVPLARVAELHLFPALKQGGVETGVAVVAAVPEVADAGGPPPNFDDTLAADAVSHPSDASAIDPSLDPPPADPAEDAAAAPRPPGSPAADREAESPVAFAADARGRHTVFTATYRLTLRGPDRGKWETQMVAEADAPLVTVEAVVQGVQDRLPDAGEPRRFTGDELRVRLTAPVWE